MAEDHANEILPGLWLGDRLSSNNFEFLKENEISHVLVVGYRLQCHFKQEIEYKVLKVWDYESEDILRIISRAIRFIHSTINKGSRLLVHCRAGMSRSATIMIAYIAWSQKISYKESYNKVKSKREIIKPNSSFFAQLAILDKALSLPLNHWKVSEIDEYEQIDLRISLLPEHFRYRADRLAIERNDNGIETLSYLGNIDQDSVTNQKPEIKIYCCSRCNTALFTDVNLMPIGKQDITELSMNNLLRKATPCSEKCLLLTKYFIEPMKWMMKTGLLVSNIKKCKGTIKCPNCKHNIGKWNWKSSQDCPGSRGCCAAIAPRFHIEKHNVTSSNQMQQ